MSCSPFDLRDYFLQELPHPQQHQVEAHLKSCTSCRTEFERLRLTEAALLALREEEIPQRIAFVSDKIFEPSRARRWFASFWDSSARLGFSGAAMLSCAIIVSALTRPAPAPVLQFAASPAPVISTSAPMPDAELQRRIDAAIAGQTQQLRAELEQARRNLQMVAADYEYQQKQMNRQLVAQAGYGMPPVAGSEPK